MRLMHELIDVAAAQHFEKLQLRATRRAEHTLCSRPRYLDPTATVSQKESRKSERFG